MKKRMWLFCLLAVCILVLAACGDTKNEAGSKDPGDKIPKDEKSEKKLSYSVVEDVTSEDGFLPNLHIDDAGKAVLFTKGTQNEYSPGVYVDEEVKDLDPETFDLFSIITSQGKVIGKQFDGSTFSYILYDAYTDEEKVYTTEQEFIPIVFRTDYLEDENGHFKDVIRRVAGPDTYEIDIVNLEEDSYETIDFTERLGEYVTSGDYYEPDVFYSNDGEKIFTLIKEESDSASNSSTIIHSYHIENDELEVVAELDEQFSLANIYNGAFSSDGESLFLLTGELILHRLDIGSGEIEELGNGRHFRSMDDNKYATFDRHTGEITITNIDSGESNVAHTIEDMDNIDFDYFAISANGDTMAYIYQDLEDDERLYHLEILHAD